MEIFTSRFPVERAIFQANIPYMEHLGFEKSAWLIFLSMPATNLTIAAQDFAAKKSRTPIWLLKLGYCKPRGKADEFWVSIVNFLVLILFDKLTSLNSSLENSTMIFFGRCVFGWHLWLAKRLLSVRVEGWCIGAWTKTKKVSIL